MTPEQRCSNSWTDGEKKNVWKYQICVSFFVVFWMTFDIRSVVQNPLPVTVVRCLWIQPWCWASFLFSENCDLCFISEGSTKERSKVTQLNTRQRYDAVTVGDTETSLNTRHLQDWRPSVWGLFDWFLTGILQVIHDIFLVSVWRLNTDAVRTKRVDVHSKLLEFPITWPF